MEQNKDVFISYKDNDEGEFVFGRGCQADIDKAYEMYKISAEHGCNQSIFIL